MSDPIERDADIKLNAHLARGARAEALEEIDGLNYSRGRETRITLYRVVPRAK